MSRLSKWLGCTLMLCFFAPTAQAEGIDEQTKSYCEVARQPSMKANVAMAGNISELAEKNKIQLDTEAIDRHPELIYLSLLKGYSWPLDNLDAMGAEKRGKLCRALEADHLEMMAINAEHARVESLCETASHPTQQQDEILIRQNAELASKMKKALKPEIAARYPLLINQQLTAESSQFCGSTQKELDNLEELGAAKRAKLCRILEKERLDLKRLDIKLRTELVLIDVMGLQ